MELPAGLRLLAADLDAGQRLQALCLAGPLHLRHACQRVRWSMSGDPLQALLPGPGCQLFRAVAAIGPVGMDMQIPPVLATLIRWQSDFKPFFVHIVLLPDPPAPSLCSAFQTASIGRESGWRSHRGTPLPWLSPSAFKARIRSITHSLLRASSDAVGSSSSSIRGFVISALAMFEPLFLAAAECGGVHIPQ